MIIQYNKKISKEIHVKNIVAISTGFFLLTGTASQVSYGQEKNSSRGLEEIIVTAQKRDESLQDTPISITAFGEERLEIEGINNLNDIGSKVPSLTIEPFPINNATLRIFIRGIGIADVQVTQDPPVGIYVDGVYIARSTGTALDVAELQRIEVLRGPQGTLYGRNTTGGAINLITKRPSTEAFEFKEKLTVGNRNQFSSKTTANIPLGDTLAAKVAYLTTKRDGFIENTGPGGDFGDREVEGYRIDLRWDISDTTTLDYAYDKSEYEYINYVYQSIRPAEQNKGQAEPVREFSVTQAKHSEDRFDSMATFRPMETSETEIEGHSLILTKGFENVQVKYIAAYRELYDASYADLGGGIGSGRYRTDSHEFCGPAARAETGENCLPLVVPVIQQEQTSHELQFAGSLFNDSVEYIVGAYYFEEKAIEDNSPLHHQFSSELSDTLLPVLEPILAPIVGTVLNLTDVTIINMLSQRYEIENTAKAVFGQFTWTPSMFDERLSLTFGGRYSKDSRQALKNQTDKTYLQIGILNQALDVQTLGPLAPILAGLDFLVPGDRAFDNIFASKDFTDSSFSFIAEYDLTDDINLYGKYVQAYKSGGFNTRDPQRGSTGTPSGFTTPEGRGDDTDQPAADGIVYGFGFADGFESEHVDSIEAGVKSELMGRRLRINANLFYSEYTDMQLNFILAGTIADTKVTNAGEAKMKGFESDITFLATQNLMLMFNYAYLDAEITKALDNAGNDITDTFVFFSAPKHSYSVSADWTIGAWDWGVLSANVSYNFMDERNGGPRLANAVNTFGSSYGLWNGRLSLNRVPVSRFGTLNFGLWGKNLSDEEYVITAIDNIPHSDRAVIWGETRTYGIDIIYEF